MHSFAWYSHRRRGGAKESAEKPWRRPAGSPSAGRVRLQKRGPTTLGSPDQKSLRSGSARLPEPLGSPADYILHRRTGRDRAHPPAPGSVAGTGPRATGAAPPRTDRDHLGLQRPGPTRLVRRALRRAAGNGAGADPARIPPDHSLMSKIFAAASLFGGGSSPTVIDSSPWGKLDFLSICD